MDVTPVEMMNETAYKEAYWLVVVELFLTIISTSGVVLLMARRRVLRPYVVYAYLPFLLLLYAHFLIMGPPPLVAWHINTMYWALIVGAPAIIIDPMLREWNSVAYVLGLRKTCQWSKPCGLDLLLSFGISISITVVWFVLLSCLAHNIQLLEELV